MYTKKKKKEEIRKRRKKKEERRKKTEKEEREKWEVNVFISPYCCEKHNFLSRDNFASR
jgi:hypothetical protein